MRAALLRIRFQFHKGTIKTLLKFLTMFLLFTDFNSIKVQLKPNLFTDLQTPVVVFQFHKGTIKTQSFNIPMKVRAGISIP